MGAVDAATEPYFSQKSCPIYNAFHSRLTGREPRPDTDVSDAEWAFAVSYSALLSPKAAQRKHDLREVFNALRWLLRTGAAWRHLPHDLPPWEMVYPQTQRWIKAGVFEDIVDDLRSLLRQAEGRTADPTAVILDSQTLQGTIESGQRAGYDAGKKKKGTKIHMAVDTLGHLVSLLVTPADVQDREMVAQIVKDVQEVTGNSVKAAFADSGYSGDATANVAKEADIELIVVKRPEGTQGFVLLPKRWVVERSFAWKTRFRRLVKDYERLSETVVGLHFCMFACSMLTSHLGTPQWGS